MASLRVMLSGREFQLRYALLRSTLIARGDDPLPAAFVRMEWMLDDYCADVLFEDERGAVLEAVECKEHDGYLDEHELRKFGAVVARLRGKPELRGTVFRYVTNGRFLPDGTDLRKDVARRAEIVGEAAEHIVFDLDVDGKDALLAIALLHLAPLRDGFNMYARLHTRLAADMADRLPAERTSLEQATRSLQRHLVLTPDKWPDLEADARFTLNELRHAFAAVRREPRRASRAALAGLSETPLPGGTVQLGQVFVDPAAVATFRIGSGARRVAESSLSVLFEWIASVRRGDPRLHGLPAIRNPLLVLGGFGNGKSSLLRMFSERLAQTPGAPTPLFIEMRNLIGASTARPLDDVLRREVRNRYGVDLDAVDAGELVLLCDAFDELDVFYMHADQRRWAEEAYRAIAALAQQPNVTVVVSARPVLLMGMRSIDPGAVSLELQPFDDSRIREWCSRYASAAGLSAEFSLEFLEQRNLLEVARTPLVLYMIARVYETRKSMLEAKRYTPAEIYRVFVSWTETGGYVDDRPDKHTVPANYRHILQDIAWQFFLTGDTMMAEDDLLASLRATYGSEVDRIPVDRNLFVAHMFLPGNAGEERGRARAIEFAHQSFREYLVAERVWRLLADARAGKPLSAEVLAELPDVPFSTAEIGFLLDMVDELGTAEARALYAALARAADVRSYFSEQAQPVNPATLPAHVATHAAFAMVLRIRLGHRLGQHVWGYDLEALMSFMRVFSPVNASVAQSQTLLLRHLRGLRVTAPTSFSRLSLGGANLDGCSMAGVDLDQSFLRGVVLTGASFRECTFRQATLESQVTYRASFRHCDFTETRIEIANDLVLGTTWLTELRGCSFERTVFDRLELAQCTFLGNHWKGAVVLRPAESILAGCILDESAFAFFSGAGVHLNGCFVVPDEDVERMLYAER